MARPVVLCAVDLGPLTRRVLLHAAGMARVMDADLKVVHVTAEASATSRQRVFEACLAEAPYEISIELDDIAVRIGRVSDMIHREARHEKAALLVIGSRGHGGLARLIMGSTSAAVLRSAVTPVLIVPPSDLDIVSMGDRAALTCGSVLAAVDLATPSGTQLRVASTMAAAASRPLLLMTVAKSRTSDHAAAQQLRERAHGLSPVKPRAIIVRRGDVAEEIVRCAATEGAGLVVMGLDCPRGRPGVIASAVLKAGRAFVLAVPEAAPAATQRARTTHAATILMLALAIVASGAAAQLRFSDVNAVVQFQRAADAYAFFHRQIERRLGVSHADPSSELSAAIREARAGAAQGQLFTPPVAATFREALSRAAAAPGCDADRGGAPVQVNSPAAGTRTLPPCLAGALPDLPPELEYRSAASALALVDGHAGVVVDVLPAALTNTDTRR